MKFKAYIDSLYSLIISYFIITSLALSVSVIFVFNNFKMAVVAVLFMLFIFTICYFICKKEYYFYKNYYVIKVGFIEHKYYYADIKKCFITENNNLSYATSLKRICIKMKNKVIFISPEKMNDVLLILINNRRTT